MGTRTEDKRLEGTSSMITKNSVILGDNLSILQAIRSECVDLIYIDPPFGTGSLQQINSTAFEVVPGYGDYLTGKDYLYDLNVRLQEMHRVLKPAGSIYVHIDWRNVHYIRLLLEQIFAKGTFVNEIIWAYDYGGRPKDRWPKKHDTLLWFAKSDCWTFNYNEIERIPYMAPGLVGPEKAAIGKLPTDTWWMTIVPTNSKERTGYPNQKPEKLLERIISACSNPGDLVADFYCGSGTTGVVAKRLDRDYLLVDSNPTAVEITEARLQ